MGLFVRLRVISSMSIPSLYYLLVRNGCVPSLYESSRSLASIPLLRNRMPACVARRRPDCPRTKWPRRGGMYLQQKLGTDCRSPVKGGCAAARLRRLAQACDLAFERGNTRRQALVFFARLCGHLLHRLELLALHDIEVAQQALALRPHQGFELAAHALRCPGSIRHQLGEFVEKAVVALSHARIRSPAGADALARLTMAGAGDRFKADCRDGRARP